MKKIALCEFVEEVGQSKAAEILGVTQPAIHKAVSRNRKIFVYKSESLVFAEEVRPFPHTKNRSVSMISIDGSC
jgi:predicted transcriptional regulator